MQALRGVDLRVQEGELCAIVGPSGSGKSTLLHIMGTLERASSGLVRIAGVDVAEASDRELAALRARRIGFVFQQFHLLEAHSALENVANGLLYTGTPARERRRAAAGGARARRARPPCAADLGAALRRRAPARSDRPGARQLRRRSCSRTSRPATSTRATGAEIIELLRDAQRAGDDRLVITHDREIAATLPRRVELRDGRLIHDEAPSP